MPESQVSAFETIKHATDEGTNYWSARELAPVLDYSRWQRFWPVIEKAMVSCANAGQALDDHFTRVGQKVVLGSGAEREIENWHLSRYACYLVVQNGDAEKPVIAAGQTYFAVQTRRAELADELAGLPEDERRRLLRDQVVDENKSLAAVVYDAGVLTGRDFAIFQDHGYRGLYAGETAADIKARKRLHGNQKILDHMGSEELAANFFRITQTEAKIRREDIQGKDAANAAHHEMGAAVRGFILDQGGTPPEELSMPAESIPQIERRRQQQIKAAEAAKRAGAAQDALFPSEWYIPYH